MSYLKEKGFDDPEVKRVFAEWYGYQEKIRGQEVGSEIKDLIEIALLYKDAGLIDDARSALDDAFFYRYYFKGDYAKIIEDGVVLKGVTYKKRK